MGSKKHEKCVICKIDEIEYAGNGLCKNCYQKKWCRENPEKNKNYQKKWRKENSEKNKNYSKKYYIKNSKKLKKYQKEYQKKHQKKYCKEDLKYFKEYNKKWRKENPEKFKKQRSDYWKKRSEIDVHFRLRSSVSCLIRKRLRNRLSSKKGNSTWKFLPYTVDDLIQHLENLFTEGMNWNNYGKWHIDHKTPDCKFNYKSINNKEFQKCWALNNLQPLWAIDNLRKSDKI